MSSHHIVREKQEPALLVLGLDNFPEEQLGQLLEWSPTVIASLHAAEKLNSLGIKIDWIVTDDEPTIQSDIKLIPVNNLTIEETALQYLISENYNAVNIITDELDVAVYAGFSNNIDLVILNRNKKIFRIMPGFRKWKSSNEIIEVFSQFDHLDYSGLEKVTEKLFRTTDDGFFSFQFDEPFLFISEEI